MGAFRHPSRRLLAFWPLANDFIDVWNLPSLMQISAMNVFVGIVLEHEGPGHACHYSAIWICSGCIFSFSRYRYRLPAPQGVCHDSPKSHPDPGPTPQATTSDWRKMRLEQPPPSICLLLCFWSAQPTQPTDHRDPRRLALSWFSIAARPSCGSGPF